MIKDLQIFVPDIIASIKQQLSQLHWQPFKSEAEFTSRKAELSSHLALADSLLTIPDATQKDLSKQHHSNLHLLTDLYLDKKFEHSKMTEMHEKRA